MPNVSIDGGSRTLQPSIKCSGCRDYSVTTTTTTTTTINYDLMSFSKAIVLIIISRKNTKSIHNIRMLLSLYY